MAGPAFRFSLLVLKEKKWKGSKVSGKLSSLEDDWNFAKRNLQLSQFEHFALFIIYSDFLLLVIILMSGGK